MCSKSKPARSNLLGRSRRAGLSADESRCISDSLRLLASDRYSLGGSVYSLFLGLISDDFLPVVTAATATSAQLKAAPWHIGRPRLHRRFS